jgi:hypothetical protein
MSVAHAFVGNAVHAPARSVILEGFRGSSTGGEQSSWLGPILGALTAINSSHIASSATLATVTGALTVADGLQAASSATLATVTGALTVADGLQAASSATLATVTGAFTGTAAAGSVLTYIGKSQSLAVLPISIADVAIGTPSADRILIITVVYHGARPPNPSLTVGGTSATLRAHGGDTWNYPAIFTIPYPSGATATLAIGDTGSTQVTDVYVYAATGLASEIPHASVAGEAPPYNLNVPANGIVVGGASAFEVTGLLITGDIALTTDDSSITTNGSSWGVYAGHATGLSANAAASITSAGLYKGIAAASWAAA